MRNILLALTLCVLGSSVRADSLTLAQVTQQISSGSVLKLRDDVAQDFAENLLAAQLPGVCSYCASQPDSLQLSIDAVLKAIKLEKSFHEKYCDDSDCQIAWTQSNIAIDDRAVVVITPSALRFAEPVNTPEPSTIVLCLAGLLWALAFSTKKNALREYPANHPQRK